MGLTILRAILILHMSAVFAQSVLAGQFLSGSDAQVRFHEITGWIALGLCAAQILAAALLMRSGVASLWLVLASVFVFLGEGLQVGSGYGRFLAVHVPLGVIIFAAVAWQMISVFLKKPLAATPGKADASGKSAAPGR